MDAQERSEDNWHDIKAIWQNTQLGWSGVNANYFASLFWAQFERDVESYLVALQALDEAISNSRVEMRE